MNREPHLQQMTMGSKLAREIIEAFISRVDWNVDYSAIESKILEDYAKTDCEITLKMKQKGFFK